MSGYNCFGCCPTNPIGAQMRFYEDGDDIISIWKPTQNHQSWINTLHGGVQAVLLDEVCGWVIFHKLHTAGVTAKMETRYLRPVSTCGGTVTLRARIAEQRRNLVTIEATLADSQGTVCTKAVCTYFAFPAEKARSEMFFQGCEAEE